jgi:hypothetical protein
MRPIENLQTPEKLEHIDENRASPPPHDTRTKIEGEGERSSWIADEEPRNHRLVASLVLFGTKQFFLIQTFL